jgi:hypothetical protein
VFARYHLVETRSFAARPAHSGYPHLESLAAPAQRLGNPPDAHDDRMVPGEEPLRRLPPLGRGLAGENAAQIARERQHVKKGQL